MGGLVSWEVKWTQSGNEEGKAGAVARSARRRVIKKRKG
jgi:hypothetical protein